MGIFKKLLTRELFCEHVAFESKLSPEQFKSRLAQYVSKKSKFTEDVPFVGDIYDNHFKIKTTYGDRNPMQVEGELISKAEGSIVKLKIQHPFDVFLGLFAVSAIVAGIVSVEFVALVGKWLSPLLRGVVLLVILLMSFGLCLKLLMRLLVTVRSQKLRFFEDSLKK